MRRLRNRETERSIELWHIRPLLTTDAAKTIASAIIGARLDYCNSLIGLIWFLSSKFGQTAKSSESIGTCCSTVALEGECHGRSTPTALAAGHTTNCLQNSDYNTWRSYI